MHDIEPFFRWRDEYRAEDDEKSPFYNRRYDEFGFSNAIYNYYIHPQWDDFGSQTLYIKILFADYNKKYAIIELMGEWNDALYNDIMYLKRYVCDFMIREGISKFILISDNVLNFHGDDDSYYQEWYEDIEDMGGWIVNINIMEHVKKEMQHYGLDRYMLMPDKFNDMEWRLMKPELIFDTIDKYINKNK